MLLLLTRVKFFTLDKSLNSVQFSLDLSHITCVLCRPAGGPESRDGATGNIRHHAGGEERTGQPTSKERLEPVPERISAPHPTRSASTWYVPKQNHGGRSASIPAFFSLHHNCIFFPPKVSVRMVSLRMLPVHGCIQQESTPDLTNMAPGVGMPNQRKGRRTGIGWLC